MMIAEDVLKVSEDVALWMGHRDPDCDPETESTSPEESDYDCETESTSHEESDCDPETESLGYEEPKNDPETESLGHEEPENDPETESLGHEEPKNDPETAPPSQEEPDNERSKMLAAAGYDNFEGDIEPCSGWNSSSAEDAITPPPGPAPPLSAEAIKYQSLPVRKAYYFHDYARRVLEAACLKYSLENDAVNLSDLEWKRRNIFPQHPDDHRAWRNWLAEGEIELECRMLYFKYRTRLHPNTLKAAIYIRNAAIHRWAGDKLSFDEFVPAMTLLRFMNDSKAEAEINDAFEYVTEDPTLDGATIAKVEAAMYAPLTPPTKDCILLARIQTLIEESCFDYASRKIPHVLAKEGWKIPEQVELPRWDDVYWSAHVQHDESANHIFPYLDDLSLHRHIQGARAGIRNPAAHYGVVLIYKLVRAIHIAIRICILQADWRRAIEVEVLAEWYLTQCSRAQVLDRLESTYRDGPVETAYEQGRRAAICGVLENEGRRHEDGDGDGDGDVRAVERLGMGDPEMRYEERTWSLSMHECLKRAPEFEDDEDASKEWETTTDETSDRDNEQVEDTGA